MTQQHVDAQVSILPAKPPKQRGTLLFILATLTVVGMGMESFIREPSASAEMPKTVAAKSDAKSEATKTAELKPCKAASGISIRSVKPIGVDRSKCVALPMDGSATCAPGQVGQKFAKVDGVYRRITCGECIKFIYPTTLETTVEMTVDGDAQ